MVSCLSTSPASRSAWKVLEYRWRTLSEFSTSSRSHFATVSACDWNSFWYLDRSAAHLVMISSIDLFLRRDWADGAGPAVEFASPLLPASPEVAGVEPRVDVG